MSSGSKGKSSGKESSSAPEVPSAPGKSESENNFGSFSTPDAPAAPSAAAAETRGERADSSSVPSLDDFRSVNSGKSKKSRKSGEPKGHHRRADSMSRKDKKGDKKGKRKTSTSGSRSGGGGGGSSGGPIGRRVSTGWEDEKTARSRGGGGFEDEDDIELAPLRVSDYYQEGVTTSTETAAALKLKRGKHVLLVNKPDPAPSSMPPEGYRTVAIMRRFDDTADVGAIRFAQDGRDSLRCRLGDTIQVRPCNDIKVGTSVEFEPTDEHLRGNWLERYIKPWFRDCDFPVTEGDLIWAGQPDGRHFAEFKVIKTDPSPYCIVDSDKTVIVAGKWSGVASEIGSFAGDGGDDWSLDDLITEDASLPSGPSGAILSIKEKKKEVDPEREKAKDSNPDPPSPPATAGPSK